jgi:hypothetical protein
MKAELILCVCRIHYVLERRQKVIGSIRPGQKVCIEEASKPPFFGNQKVSNKPG